MLSDFAADLKFATITKFTEGLLSRASKLDSFESFKGGFDVSTTEALPLKREIFSGESFR